MVRFFLTVCLLTAAVGANAELELISEAQIGGPQGNFNSINATINHAGDVIAFESAASNLTAGGGAAFPPG